MAKFYIQNAKYVENRDLQISLETLSPYPGFALKIDASTLPAEAQSPPKGEEQCWKRSSR